MVRTFKGVGMRGMDFVHVLGDIKWVDCYELNCFPKKVNTEILTP